VGSQSSTVKPSVDPNDPLYKARRVTRFMMFPWIFNGWDDTEERMKKTIKIEVGLSLPLCLSPTLCLSRSLSSSPESP
jgi:hypothetical protein